LSFAIFAVLFLKGGLVQGKAHATTKSSFSPEQREELDILVEKYVTEHPEV